jgi:AcrR family transcriptional regulator
MTTPDSPAGQSRKPVGAAVLQPDKTDAIVAAFYDELAEGGPDKLTMDRVAARAGVGKAALYRRWRSKEQMLTELIAALGDQEHRPAPDLGDLRADLSALFTQAVDFVNDPLIRQVIAYLIATSRSSPELIEAMRPVPGPDRAAAQAILRHATDRGELAPDTDIQIALDLITGVLWRRMILADETLDRDYPERLTAMLLRALGVDPGDSDKTRR